MSCHDIYPLLVRHDLTGADADHVAAHLASCAPCREAVALLRSSTELAPGTEIESYRITRLVGRGGMGSVYEAKHTAIARRVAIKVLHRELVAVPDLRARFTRDGEIAAGLRGDHICRTTSLGVLPTGEPYLVLEFLDGEDLQSMLDRGARPAVVEYGVQICEGLAEAHAAGIVHRDLKPANLMLVARPTGEPLIKILDFGVAKLWQANDRLLTATGVALGSVPYMSPEQLRSSRTVDARSDIWSIGATLYHLASGRPPFPARASLPEAAIRVWSEEPPPLRDVQLSLADAIARCLQKRADDRFADVAALAAALAPDDARIARIARILRPQ